jgi:hypothetical protein
MITNNVARIALVAKIDLTEVPVALRKEFFPNLNDAFMVSHSFADAMETTYTRPRREEAEAFKPVAGSKMHGQFRDKGSVCGVTKKMICLTDYVLNTETEINNLIQALKDLGKMYYLRGNVITIEIDVIANPSLGRDNVVALLKNGILEQRAILEGVDFELTISQAEKMTIEECCGDHNYDHRVYVVDGETGELIHDFGKHLVLLEDYFWQPQHDNRIKMEEVEIPLSYQQALDGLDVLLPSLSEVVRTTANFNSVAEDMMLMGLQLDTALNNNIPSTLAFELPSKKDDAILRTISNINIM